MTYSSISIVVLSASCQAGLRGVGLYESNSFSGISVSMAGGGNLNIASGDQAFDGFAMQNMVSYKTSDLGGDLNLALPFLSGK